MATQWLRRGWLLAACASVLLAACGGGDVDSQFTPDRMVAFGDAMGDLGQNGARYTINDGSLNNWTQFVAQEYGRSLEPTATGGLSYARGNARIREKPDAAGSNATLTVTEQVDAFLAGNAPVSSDMVLFSGGTADVIVQARGVIDGAQDTDQALAAVGQAGRDYAAQVRRIVDAGGTHVIVSGPYNLGRSPWAKETGQGDLLEDLSSNFNNQLLVALVDFGDRVLYVDAALYFNLVESEPSNYDLRDASLPACTSVDPGPGIGTGNDRVNSNLCTLATVRTEFAPDEYLFADRVYPSAKGHRLFGDYARGRILQRW
jgi:outer membrane lipase/esterase